MIFFWYVVLLALEDFQKVPTGLSSIYTEGLLVRGQGWHYVTSSSSEQ